MRVQAISLSVSNPRFNEDDPNIQLMDYEYKAKINDKDYIEKGIVRAKGGGTGFRPEGTSIESQLVKDWPESFEEDEYDSRGIMEALSDFRFQVLDFRMLSWENLEDIQDGLNDIFEEDEEEEEDWEDYEDEE